MRLAMDKLTEAARELAAELAGGKAAKAFQLPVKEILTADQTDQTGIEKQRERIVALKKALKGSKEQAAVQLLPLALDRKFTDRSCRRP